MTKNIIIGVLAVALAVSLLSSSNIFGSIGIGPSHYQKENFLQGLSAGTSGQFNVTNAGVISDSAAVTFSGDTTLSGANTVSGDLTATADVREKSPVRTGAVAAIAQTAGATTSVITAANICDSEYATTTPSITAASTLTTPTAALLFSDCLTTNGDVESLYVLNTTASTTAVTAGTSSTIAYDGSTGGSVTLAASSWAHLRFVRTSATAYVTIMDQYKF